MIPSPKTACDSMPTPGTRYAVLGLLCCYCVIDSALALEVKTGIQVGSTYTDNAQLESNSTAKSDFFFDITPRISASEKAARFDAELAYAPRIIYSPFDNQRSETQNTLSGVASLEAVPDNLFLDADVSIAQSYLSPFGATPLDDGARSSNFTETNTYGLSPVWKGRMGNDLTYETRYRWKRVDTDADSTLGSDVSQWSATINKAAVHQFGWALSLQRRETDFKARPDTNDQRLNATLFYRVDPELQLSVSGGYEKNSFSVEEKSTVTYGAGVQWTPTQRSALSANWEHRYFGESYSLDLSHRFRTSRIKLTASRSASTFAERFLDQGLINQRTGDLLINERLDKLYPDPSNRQAVTDYLASRGYLTEGQLLGIYTDQVQENQNLLLSYEILGARNNLVLSIYRYRTETVIENFSPVIPADIGLNANNVRTGFSARHEYAITPRASLTVDASRSNTESTIPGNNGESTESTLSGSVTQRLTGRTSVTLGARYRNLDSNVGLGFTERAVFGTINHSF